MTISAQVWYYMAAAWSLKRHLRGNWYALLNTTLILGAAELAAYYIWFEPSWLSYRVMPIEVVTKQVHPGEQVTLRISRCSSEKHGRMYPIAYRMVPEFTGQTLLIMPSIFAPVEPGCTVEDRPAESYKGAKPGRYHFEGYAQVRGLIRLSTIDWKSESFELVQP